MSAISIISVRNGVWLNGEMLYSSVWSTVGMIIFGLTLGTYAIFKLNHVGRILGINSFKQKCDQNFIDKYDP